jgi:hypothetical protein
MKMAESTPEDADLQGEAASLQKRKSPAGVHPQRGMLYVKS